MQRLTPFFFALVAMISACERSDSNHPADTHLPAADTVFFGENIITMDPENPQVEAVAILGAKIETTGSRADIEKLLGPETRIVELGKNALLPGFIDAHGHFSAVARFLKYANLSSPPIGNIESIDDLVAALEEHARSAPVSTQWLIGYGYDDSLLAEGRHPDRDDLDRVSRERPIALLHVSGHLAALNSAALLASGITAEADDPPGGVIRRRSGSREPNGVLEETAASSIFFARAFAMEPAQLVTLLRETVGYYASYGITTIQDGATTTEDIALMREAAAEKAFDSDINAFPHSTMLTDDAFKALKHEPGYQGGFRVAGVKFSLDGSPQGRTAWLSQPYTEGPPNAAADYRAYPTMEPDLYKERISEALNRGLPVLAHANGDAAIDLMLEGVQEALLGSEAAPDHRTVAIHAQLMRKDQVVLAKELGVIPSFYIAHPYFWGDWHRLSFGDERAFNISPIRWAIDNQLPFTIHNDAPVTPPDMMRLMWVAVNRKTRSDFVLGPEQRATALEALHAITLGAAYQNFEEDRKGSITPGKQADLVIIDRNLLSAKPDSIRDINILETIARGKTIYRQAD